MNVTFKVTVPFLFAPLRVLLFPAITVVKSSPEPSLGVSYPIDEAESHSFVTGKTCTIPELRIRHLSLEHQNRAVYHRPFAEEFLRKLVTWS